MKYFGVLVIVFAIVLGISIFYSKQFNRNDRFKLAMVSLIVAGLALITLIIPKGFVSSFVSLLIIVLSTYLVVRFFHSLNHYNHVTVSNVKKIKYLLRSSQAKSVLSSMRKTIIIDRAMALKILKKQGRIKTSDYQNKQIENILYNADERDLNNAKHMAKITIENLNEDIIKKIQEHLDKHQNN